MADIEVTPEELSGVRQHVQNGAEELEQPAKSIPEEMPDAGASTAVVGTVISSLSGFTGDLGSIYGYVHNGLGDNRSNYLTNEDEVMAMYPDLEG